MTLIQDLKSFNIADSTCKLWTFKKQNPKDQPPKYNGHWVDTTEAMVAELKGIIRTQLQYINEQMDYSLLAENNEASVLTITEEETHAGLIKHQFADELPQRKIKNVKTLFNCAFYVIKLVHEDQVLYAVRKTDTTWKSKTASSIVTALFSDAQLDLAEDENFRIQKTIDFFGMAGEIAVRNKSNFESILNYKAAHEQDYAQMSHEDSFLQIFDELQPLTDFIGSNKIHLRRMSAIRQKAFYADPVFMENLRDRHQQYGLNIVFDEDGKIVPSEETCRDIIAALLDHRLSSAFSGNIYDVPDATIV
ncbi:hypothetical protein PhaeoP83_02666 [Phaeobacter inhibens]|uniref:DUF4868 domain-containing protein n=1 Tax=Phaeobacter inhibens TaxID=221822 RepID=A0ABM6RIU0_9RHOB|nr:Kiwa anti-phage protein KwaB-like domain-containing protein [Phaeobacter inhibens]AUQ50916.1 hypothetical protein PhaeoP83_02666 [Phaeobacter inhibens]AUQ96438.1 hypothetical protein PhaeoP66_03708 [Phaeobacter inhibens]AUR20721.1 hypothetical protein PhaeoP80_02666 [Phaeobacter inhibens]